MGAAIIVHFAMGFYMYSNSQIFTYTQSISYIDQLKKQISGHVNSIVSNSAAGDYLPPSRILQPHALVYLAGLVTFVLTLLFSHIFLILFGDRCAGFCCCCFAGSKHKSKLQQTFSNDIYSDLSVEDLKAEYAKTKTEVSDYRALSQAGLVSGEDSEAVNKFITSQENKLRQMKAVLSKKMQAMAMGQQGGDTLADFDALFKKTKNDASHRLKALYSYDIKDNPAFKRAQAVEARIRKMYANK